MGNLCGCLDVFFVFVACDVHVFFFFFFFFFKWFLVVLRGFSCFFSGFRFTVFNDFHFCL